MKTTITVEKEIDIKKVLMNVAVRYEEEDMPNDFPFRKGDMWSILIDVDSGVIEDWPKGKAAEVYMKVCDQGSYYLVDDKNELVASIEEDYVPNYLIPGEYGDYIDLKINEDGKITNWPSKPSFIDFFPEI